MAPLRVAVRVSRRSFDSVRSFCSHDITKIRRGQKNRDEVQLRRENSQTSGGVGILAKNQKKVHCFRRLR